MAGFLQELSRAQRALAMLLFFPSDFSPNMGFQLLSRLLMPNRGNLVVVFAKNVWFLNEYLGHKNMFVV